MEEAEDQRRYHVVVNDEEQYSIWPVGSEPPPGWQRAGVEGDRATCLAHIDEVWTDLRPRGLREWLTARV
ncbi:MbtH family protein [Micromonospora sp. NBC_01796]|uniref:MbtH family protein n=1 Tax=Micromonospora sp. NBC_01796 TaxID=2975987 RepID=UPI002DDC8DE1|nr:MbtH family protein [Micromonospora sp. NBC_01796]WSA83617.1 MbtH family protein [Micromonospora sp. NBC_01796]